LLAARRKGKKERKATWLGRAGEKRELAGLGRKEEKKEEKEKERWARPTRKREGKRNAFQMHLNLKPKFKWKTINKTMQWA
jgi:hypothetical protein